MASTKSLLNRKGSMLRRMSEDLASWELNGLPWFVQDPRMSRPMDQASADHSGLGFWSLPQPAPATLGDGVRVTPWRFASQFVSQFERWRRATQRWERLFGSDRLPRQWRAAASRCNGMAGAIAANRNFQRALMAHRTTQLLSQGPDWSDGTTDGLFEWIVSAQRLADLLRFCRSANSQMDFLDWLSRDIAVRTSPEALLSNVQPPVRAELEWHLSKYRARFLEAQCLEAAEDTQNSPTRLLLDRNRTMKLPQIVEPLIQDLEIQLTPELMGILDTLGNLINDIGFAGLSEHLASTDFSSLPVGSDDRSPINVIPGQRNAACAKFVLALFKVADSRNPALCFNTIMSALRAHLVQCQRITSTVIVLADWWNGDSFGDHATELSAWRRQGVQFLFLLVSQPHSTISPLRIRL